MQPKSKIVMVDNTASAEANASRAAKDVAPFLKQLRNMLNAEHASVLRWTANGRAFEIVDMQQMMDYVLPKYFKHRKYTSFQRQLNYFNFRKWTKSKATVCTFSNEFFQRDQPELAWRITRKKSIHGPLHQQLKSNLDKSRKAALETMEMTPPSSPEHDHAPTMEASTPTYWAKTSPAIAHINVPSDELHAKASFPSPTDFDMMLQSHDYPSATLHFAELTPFHSHHHSAHYAPQPSYAMAAPVPSSLAPQNEQFEWIDALLPFVDRIEDEVYPYMYPPTTSSSSSSSGNFHAFSRPYDYVAL